MFKRYAYFILFAVGAAALSGCNGSPEIPDSSSGTLSSVSTVQSSSEISISSLSSVTIQSSSSHSSVAAVLDAPEQYTQLCAACHGPDGIRSTLVTATPLDLSITSEYGKFERVTVSRMPPGNFGACDNACAVEIKNWIIALNNLTEADKPDSASSAAPAADARFVSFFAVNVGGGEVTGDSGVIYKADQGFTGGETANQEGVFSQVADTKEDAVFFTERYGESTYSLEVPNGFYNVELGFVELIADQESGARVFNVAMEGKLELQNIDPVAESGASRTALIKEVANIEVTDGKMDIALQKVTFNPTLSFINIKRAETAEDQYVRMCSSCHGGPEGKKRSSFGDALVNSRCATCGTRDALVSYIWDNMPYKFAESCVGDCAEGIADYILDNFAGYGGRPDVQLPDFLDKKGDIGQCGPAADVEYSIIRRLARVDYGHMVRDLFKLDETFTDGFAADQLIGSFSINSSDLVEPGQVRQYFDTALAVADKAVASKTQWMPCSNQTDTCIQQVIDDVGRRAFRRPIANAEKTRLMGVYAAAKNAEDFDRGLSVLIQSILTAPQFLYYVEQGEGSGSVKSLTQYELAARMALFLWRSLPDDTLLDLAANNQLQTDAQIADQAQRMLNDQRARDVVDLFHNQWMNISNPRKGTEGFDEQLAAVEDFSRTIQAITFGELDLNGDGQKEAGSVKDLFTVDFGFLNNDTKSLYEVSGSALESGPNGFDLYKLNADRRRGLLTRAPFLRSNHSPTTRGLFVREHVLCGVIPSPPPTAADADQATDEDLNPRQLFAKHTQDPGCAGCHLLMDPLGFPLDNYDALGQWRTEYGGGFTVDASGGFIETDIDGDFTGAQVMQTQLAKSRQVQTCYSYHWFQFAAGRVPDLRDSCSLGQINQNEDASIQDVMTAIVLSDSFRNRRAAP